MSLIPLGFWAASGGGAGGAYELIESNILTSSASSVTFSSIPQDYKHLQIRMTTRTDSSNTSLQLRFNSDTGSNYANHYLRGNGSSVSSYGESSNSAIRMYLASFSTQTANIFTANLLDILDYTSATKNTTTRALDGVSGSSGNTLVQLESGLWNSTSAVTSATLLLGTGNFVSGSRFSLYGIRG